MSFSEFDTLFKLPDLYVFGRIDELRSFAKSFAESLANDGWEHNFEDGESPQLPGYRFTKKGKLHETMRFSFMVDAVDINFRPSGTDTAVEYPSCFWLHSGLIEKKPDALKPLFERHIVPLISRHDVKVLLQEGRNCHLNYIPPWPL